MNDFFYRELNRRQIALFFLAAILLYVLPLILADFRYIDDNWRALEAGMGWTGQGRWFVDLLYQVLSFTGAAPDIFPLPLLLAALAMSLALTRLTFHYFPQPTLVCCLVPLPIWYNPFLLQNLSYQYDGPAMALSLVAVIYAVTFQGASRMRQWCVPAGLLMVSFGLYQISVNVFLGLCCLELLRAAYKREPYFQLLKMLGWKVAQFGLAVLIYLVSAVFLMGTERTALLNWKVDPLLQIGINIGRVVEKVALLFHGGYTWLLAALILWAIIGAMRLGCRILERKEQRWKTAVLILGGLLTLPLLILLIPGIALFFRDFNECARTLMGFGVLLMSLFYLAFLALAPIHPRLPLLLIIPLLATLSLSFAYGRVLTFQKTFSNGALYSLAYDITSHRELYEAKRIYLSATPSYHWLASARGSFQELPVLPYLLNVYYFMLPENLSSMGITNVAWENDRHNATYVGFLGYVPVVDNRNYRIYLLGDYGFIVLKEPVWVTRRVVTW
ncbi:glucosyltransferase GtrII-like protein [Pseudomonas sp. SJZ085]|nr:glucosyltransferase GtrII-like protein [Pseudomonas sp. SJZ075]TWC25716.1 glucosyltransferase GtrII-like protein [Pseudomonas sp. SJZ074]TWC35835.1 glucosyltransferase GtrII-like protein [Pseudomonas sp. SJZ078]TWC42527.1 glucosyltransferase GtrII-like protein [Pseudomonas sp. SJZ085]TWC56703.1 glucosyltransferase GtrII-like protein [Pseudomonas sp. SJZ124]TWC91912.1 glucosyltransferase GtrII-like protein [Pseudomonas sp. SJZ101]